MISFAIKSFEQLFSPPFRKVLLKSLGLTLGLFVIVWFGLQALLGLFTVNTWPWIDSLIAILAGVALIVGMAFIMGPVTALFAGLFLDEIARTVETTHYGADPPGKELVILPALWIALKFTTIVIVVNLFVLLFILLPGLNLIAYLIGLWANAYLLGREYFQMVGLRHMQSDAVHALRLEHKRKVLFAGGIIAFLAGIPLVNFLVPLFATGFMVHVFKSCAGGTDLKQIELRF